MNATRTKAGTWVGFLLILVWCLLPVVWILSLSFKGPNETAAGSPQFLPKEWTVQNYRDIFDDPDFRLIVERDLETGQHRNPGRVDNWFTTSYFHLPDELRGEAEEAGANIVGLFGVEGLAAWLRHLADRWDDPEARDLILASIRRTESEPTLSSLSQHMLLVARRPDG